MILDMLGIGHACIQDCLSSGPITVYTYGVLLAAAYLLGLQLAMVARQGARARRQPRPRPRHLHHHQRARRREAAAADHRLPHVHRQPARAADARPLGRRLLRRPDSRGRRRAAGTSAASACRSGRRATCSRRASRSATSSAASAACSPAAATASRRRCRGAITFTDPFAAANVGTPLGVPLHPTQLYEAGAELLILVLLLVDRAQGPAVRRPDVLALHAALRDLALHHRVLPRRRARHGRHVLDLAVHLARARAAGHRHAGLSGRARAGARAARRRAQGGREPRDRHADFTVVPTTATAQRLDRFLVVGARRTRARRFSG